MVSKRAKFESPKLAKKEKKVKKVFGFMEILARVDWYVKKHQSRTNNAS